MAEHDYATVRIFEMDEYLEVFFTRGDTVTRDVVKAHKGRWDRGRRCWKVEAQWARVPLDTVIERIRDALLQAAPKGWQESLPKLKGMCSVTRLYTIRFGEGGVRLELPSGHKHDWTLKESGKAEKDDRSWLIPASVLDDPAMKKVVFDAVEGDRNALATALDYLKGFVVFGEINLAEGEAEVLGLKVGDIVAADPSFVRKVDSGIEKEPLTLYPLKLLSMEKGEEATNVRFEFVTGKSAYVYLRQKLDPTAALPPALDMRHAAGKWARRRAS